MTNRAIVVVAGARLGRRVPVFHHVAAVDLAALWVDGDPDVYPDGVTVAVDHGYGPDHRWLAADGTELEWATLCGRRFVSTFGAVTPRGVALPVRHALRFTRPCVVCYDLATP